MVDPVKDSPHKETGPLVGIVIIVLVFALGGLYFWGERLSKERKQRERANKAEETSLAADLNNTSSSSLESLEEAPTESSSKEN